MRIPAPSREIKQLYKTVKGKVQITVAMGRNGPETRVGENVPIMFWPDGSCCLPINMYLMELVKEGLATNSIKSYASNLSHFVRYTFNEMLAFEKLWDSHFEQFAAELAEERHPLNPTAKRRDNDQVNKIIRKALEFLRWYQRLFCPTLRLVVDVGEEGQIHISWREFSDASGKTHQYLWHECMSTKGVRKIVHAISANVIDALLDACAKSVDLEHFRSKFDLLHKNYVLNRRMQMLHIKADTGARRVEVCNMTVDDVMDAKKMMDKGLTPMIRMMTAKREGGAERFVPIPKATLKSLLDFIEMERMPFVNHLIKRVKKIKKDPGWIFLNGAGEQLKPDTMTREVSMLRKIAGIEEAATLHMFRHRWITLQVLERIKAFVGKRLPVNIGETILREVSRLTGHKDPNSLWCYIDFAFQEMKVWDTAKEVLNMRFNAEAALRILKEIRRKHPEGKGYTLGERSLLDDVLKDLLESIPSDKADLLTKGMEALSDGHAPTASETLVVPARPL